MSDAVTTIGAQLTEAAETHHQAYRITDGADEDWRAGTPQISYPPTEVFRFDAATFEPGLSAVEAAPGERVRTYDPARTVIDLMRLRHRFGEPLAHAALQRYVRRSDARPAQLLRLASALGVYGPVRLALDVASAQ